VQNRNHTRDLVTAALLAALLAASAWITIPIGAVPITLQVLVVVLAALLLPPWWAGSAALVYVLVGLVGLPVFAGAQGGAGVLVGPTGGYLIGFVAGAWFGSFVRCLTAKRLRTVAADGLAAFVVVVVVYVVGTVQLALVAGLSAGQAIAAGVLPFIAGDAIKAGVAVSMAVALRRAGVSVARPTTC
jgi:biotin transport system substrate-specific component